MPARHFLVDLILKTLADPTATVDAPLFIAPDGTLKRQQVAMPTKRVFGLGTFSFVVPAGVTSLKLEVQAAGGGGGGGSLNGMTPGGNGGDGGNTEILRGITSLALANGGKGGRGGSVSFLPPTAGWGGWGGTGGISYRGQDATSTGGANGGVATVDPQRGLAGANTQNASSGGGGSGGQSSGYGGGGGEYLTSVISVTPGETLTLNVGAPGVGGTAGSVGYTPGRPGGGGFVVLTW
jgi:hypothetical protein